MADFEDIKSFWEKAGEKETDDNGLRPTARDPHLQDIIEYHIMKYLHLDYLIADIGCGDGYSTSKFASKAKKIIGVDYSNTLIDRAIKYNNKTNIEYVQDDVLSLNNIPDNYFDVTINIRCLINLPTEEMQFKGLENIFKKLKSGGLCIFNEGLFLEFENLNIGRIKNNLSPMKVAEYNKLFINDKLIKWFLQYGEILDCITFGDYIYGSRIIHPTMVGENNVKHNSHINEVFKQIHFNEKHDKYPEYSYTSIYVIKKY